MSKDKEVESTRPSPDLFLEPLRKTLEHIADALWLEQNSPLTSVFFASSKSHTGNQGHLQLTGRQELDAHLRSIWKEWDSIHKTPLQALIWQTVGQFPKDVDDQAQLVLLLTYFDLAEPKQSQVIKTLAIGRSTYYRYLERAVETLGFEIVKNLRPALKLEQPQPRILAGRVAERKQATDQLNQGNVVQLIGSSGMGKTSLGASIAAEWEHPVFWYTFRPQLTDSLPQMLFSLAFFLHQQGASELWIFLSSYDQGRMHPDRAIMALRQNLEEFKSTPILFCFDEVDLLLASDLNDSESHIQLRGFLEEWSRMDRFGSPILMMGQTLLIEPDPDCLILLSQLLKDQIDGYMQNLGIQLTPSENSRLHKIAKGNPLLLRLFGILHLQGLSIDESEQQLASTITLDWFWQNLRQRLNQTEQIILREISVFSSGAPKNGWRRYTKSIENLIRLGVLEETTSDSLSLHPALRSVIYSQLPASERERLHFEAGTLLAERSQFTSAAYHLIEGGRPEIAIWTWYTHRHSEMDQGQASLALSLFAPLSQTMLPRDEDQRALALLITQLGALAGWTTAGLDVLDGVEWADESVSTVFAHERRGWLLSEAGEMEYALEEFRKSLEMVESLRSTEEIQLRLHIARRSHNGLSDLNQAKSEAMLARFSLDILDGKLADAAGNYAKARLHYANALAVADQIPNKLHLARLHEALGIMEARYAHADAAVAHFKKAGNYHQESGNLVCAVGVSNTNISFSYLVKREYEKALEPGEKALEFYRTINHPYWLAINEANLAEITFYLGRLDEARSYATSGLKREEPGVRPYCLYVLGHLSRVEKDFKLAEKLCRDAIQSAQEIGDPWAEAPACNALGEVFRDSNRLEDAETAFNDALSIWKRIGIEHEIEHTQQFLDRLQETN